VNKENGEAESPQTGSYVASGLLRRLRETWRVWGRQPHPEPPNPLPEPTEAVRRGCLDVPATGRVVRRGAVKFHGWTQFSSGPASRIELWLGDRSLGPARLGLPRWDVCRALELKPGEASGFELTAILDDWPEGETTLRAVATSVNGERLELDPQLLEIVSPAPARSSSPSPPSERTPHPPSRAGLRTLVFTHQLDLGGAQLYLMDLLRELLRIEAVNPTVVSAWDGHLRGELEQLGVPVHVTGTPPSESLASHLGHIEELAAWADDRAFEVAFVNTATSLATPGAEVAARLEIPAVWAIHESLEPSELWGHVNPAIRSRAVRALGEAAQTLFVAEATQRLFEPTIGPGRGLAIPYGLDLDPIDACRLGFDRDGARRAVGIPADAEVILCVGSIEPRKAQIPLAQAFDLVAERHPRARLVFVGGRDDSYSRFLAEFGRCCGRAERIEIVPMTPEVQPWFGLADLAVCASDVESLPRTVLEAMAWETPVVATSVFGLPDVVREGETGWLCEPRDLTALAEALDRALASSPQERRRIGLAGRRLVERRHSLEGYGREVTELLHRVVAGPRVERLVDAAAR
jgi:D-inositol-3-phosphate glycosyltransferase